MTKLAEGGSAFIPKMELPLLGVGGSFVLPSAPTNLLLIAGGIGITPFLSFLDHLARSSSPSEWKVQLLVSTREPQVTLDLIRRSLSTGKLNLKVHLFSPSDTSFDPKTDFSVSQHQGRITEQAMKEAVEESKGGKVYLCGPTPFEASVQAHLRSAGVAEKEVETENFNY